MLAPTVTTKKVSSFLFSFLFVTLAPLVRADEPPANLGLGLRNLVSSFQKSGALNKNALPAARGIQSETSGEVVVNIHLNGARGAEEVANDLRALGLTILLVDSSWRSGVISASLPLDQAEAAASLAGVQSVLLAPRPICRAGKVTAESSVVNRTQLVNAKGYFTANGILGKGISVGIVSDSYDGDQSAPRAALGVASGDLPGNGNPDGYTQPVVVINDNFAPSGGQTDEGRAMAEIIHDLAPAAKLAFSTVQQTQSIMAYSIRNLRANTAASCDIIVDDVFFFDEPFFSDGQLAQAVEDVVNGTALPGKKVFYFSAAGNEANQGYSSDVRLLTPTQGLAANNSAAAPQIHLDFSNVPAALYAGGFHNFNATGARAITMPITAADPTLLDFQWDDPFDAKKVTTDYNLLVFDSTGAYQGGFSGTDNNLSTDEPLELALLPSDDTYYLVIALATPAPPVATHLRFIAPSSSLSSPYISYESASMVGHATAQSANAVAAYNYNATPDRVVDFNPGEANPPPQPYTPGIEYFTSNGGALVFYFDSAGNRLATPQVRLKPDMAAADGVDTTFFGSDSDNDTFPNFFGTSAAAPTAAGVAALMLEAAGGPGKLTAAEVRAKLQGTAMPHDLDPFFCNATATNGSATVRITAHGNESNDSANDPNFFTVAFSGSTGQTLSRLKIDLTNPGLVFDPDPASGFPFTSHSASGRIQALPTFSSDRSTLTIDFVGTFLAGDTLYFGVDRDFAATNASGNSADLLAGATITATINGATQLLGAFANNLGSGFTFADGYGLIDATAAVKSIVAPRFTSTALAANISTRAVVGTADNVLIGGFIVQGSPSKRVVLRAIGPSLQNNGLPLAGRLMDPILELHDANGNTIAANNNWQDDSGQAAQIQSAGLAPTDPRESALAQTLGAATYTAIVRGANNSSGTALVEIYDLDQQTTSSRLANISSRGVVQTGDNAIIGGFILTGSSSDVVVRALGPSLTSAGVNGALADPMLELYDGQGNLLSTNDNWQQDSSQASQVQAAGLAPANALESAIAANLSAGNYTAVVRGANGATGVALVEMYNLR